MGLIVVHRAASGVLADGATVLSVGFSFVAVLRSVSCSLESLYVKPDPVLETL